MEQEQKIVVNNQFSKKLSWKRKLNLELAESAFDYLEDEGIKLPRRHVDFRDEQAKVSEELSLEITERAYALNLEEDFDHLARFDKYRKRYGDKAKSFKEYTEDQYQRRITHYRRAEKQRIKAQSLSKELQWLTDPETGECVHDEYAELAKMAYTLKKHNKACYAIFQNGTTYAQQFIAAWYSKHRLDEVWNWRKSQLIRKLWRDFLLETKVYEQYKPMHLMLTVPHTAEGWNGKQFYGAELIEKFNFMRKNPEWKKMIYGGEYGLEVTRTGKNGLHIHLHCLVFQRKGYTVNEVWKWIADHWHSLTNAEITHYEPLYIYKKDSKTNQFIRNESRAYRVNPRTNQKYLDQDIGSKKKFYLDDTDPWYRSLKGEDKLKGYVNGVMECIKYHFKNDNFRDENGNWDMELIKDVLNNSKNMRFYSKFGAFYTEKALNYSRIEKDNEETITDDESDSEDLNGNVDRAESRLINPFTKEKAKPEEFVRVLATPEHIRHLPKEEGYKPIVSHDHNGYFAIRHDLDMKAVMKNIGRGSFRDVLEACDYERFLQKVQTV